MEWKMIVFLLLPCCFLLISGNTLKKSRQIFKSSRIDNTMEVSDFSVYYDIDTNETIRKMMPRPWYQPGWLLRFPFRGGKCVCEELKCTCCTGVRIPAFNFDRRTCAILTYEPTETMIDLEVKMNNETVLRNSYSARNPPPFCVPIPVPYLPPGLVDMCVRLFDIKIVDQKLHVCMDMDTRIDKAPVVVLHFDCMDMGFNGVGLSKPSGSTNISPGLVEGASSSTESTQVAYDIFDPITDTQPTTEAMFTNTVKYI
ncbi:uncharacterized protein LOC114241394 [Bombyx mandarina]|uniref:DUF4773 domain-containing protein n=2 Tax=Bombyx TaxID=7090 RepID=A0A8R2C9E7_BOMMO|nr:uncharacterized protein LOC105842467 [Bombyx mori]XP_028028018.1 uncharacterized protein LOC114241394 [Bombyx mandarina]